MLLLLTMSESSAWTQTTDVKEIAKKKVRAPGCFDMIRRFLGVSLVYSALGGRYCVISFLSSL
ncbi:hypothetical protein EMIT0P171_90013 [Pseudomonas sp. IT-P171]